MDEASRIRSFFWPSCLTTCILCWGVCEQIQEGCRVGKVYLLYNLAERNHLKSKEIINSRKCRIKCLKGQHVYSGGWWHECFSFRVLMEMRLRPPRHGPTTTLQTTGITLNRKQQATMVGEIAYHQLQFHLNIQNLSFFYRNFKPADTHSLFNSFYILSYVLFMSTNNLWSTTIV